TVAVERFVQRCAGPAPLPNDLGFVGGDLALGAGCFEGGDDLVEGIQGFSVVIGHAPLITLFPSRATPVSTIGFLGTIAITLDLGAGVESITLGAEPGSVGTARRFVLAQFA